MQAVALLQRPKAALPQNLRYRRQKSKVCYRRSVTAKQKSEAARSALPQNCVAAKALLQANCGTKMA